MQRYSFRFLFFWLFAALCEIPFLLMCVSVDFSNVEGYQRLAIAAHVLSAVTMFFTLPKGRGWFDYARHWPQTFFFLTLCLPLFGWLFSPFLYFLYRPPKDKELLFQDDLVYQPQATKLEPKESKDEQEQRIHKSLDFVPLADILSGEDIQLKRGAIEKLAQMSTTESIDSLLLHRSDTSPEVRFYITSALTRIKKDFDEKLEAAKNQMRKDINNITSRLQLAQTYYEYVHSNLLDQATKEAYLHEASYHLEFILSKNSTHAKCYMLLLKIYEEKSLSDKALQLIDKMEQHHISDENQLKQKRLNLLFEQKNIPEFYKKLKEYKNSKQDLSTEWNSHCLWWGIN